MDNLTQAERSDLMRRVRSRNTSPEIAVRRIVHRLGYRYRLHDRGLPGNPDIVFPSRGKIILVHGCFWHGHRCRAGLNTPVSNTAYWTNKLSRNKERDQRNIRRLRKLGWNVLVVWECELARESLIKTLNLFLEETTCRK
jgi:DNA mismatch endonuclease (patch repair protein)